MRFHPFPYRLSFLVPEGAQLTRCPLLLDGCELVIHAAGLVSIGGPSREAVFDNAGNFLAVVCCGLKPLSIAATMVTERRSGMPSGRDSWTIVVGATIAFCATGLPPHIPSLLARPPPELTLLRGGRSE